MSEEESFFEHEPIDLERPAFRLLHLIRGDGPIIECMLYQAFLDGTDTVPYDALSYTWGTLEKTATVKVNGKPLKITANLHSALQQLRSQDSDKTLWVDAICIDQDNERERGHQVQQMCKIYSQSEEVIVWLGEATHETDILMDSLNQLQEYSSTHPYRAWGLKQWTTTWEVLHQHEDARLAEGLSLLLSRPWFRRVWVLQEVARSRKARVQCGTKSVKAHTFSIAPHLLDIEPERHCQAVLDIMPGLLRETCWWSERRDLYNLLSTFSNSEASDPRDNVYALLGISSDTQDNERLMPDYTKDLKDVLHDTSLFMFGKPFETDETMSKFLTDLSSRNVEYFLDIVRTSDVSEVEQFLVRRGLDVPLPEETTKAIMENEDHGTSIMSLLIRERGNEIKVTEWGVLAAGAAENLTCGVDVMGLILGQCKTRNDYDEVVKALQTASARGNEVVVRLLLDRSAIVNSLDPHGDAYDQFCQHVLYSASTNGQKKILENLFSSDAGSETDNPFQSKCNPNALTDKERFELAFALASANGHEEILQLLLENGVDINMERTYSITMHRKLRASKYQAVDLLAKMGARAERYTQIRIKPLHLAAKNGYKDVVRFLLDKGAELDAESNIRGKVAAKGHMEVMKLLNNRIRGFADDDERGDDNHPYWEEHLDEFI